MWGIPDHTWGCSRPQMHQNHHKNLWTNFSDCTLVSAGVCVCAVCVLCSCCADMPPIKVSF